MSNNTRGRFIDRWKDFARQQFYAPSDLLERQPADIDLCHKAIVAKEFEFVEDFVDDLLRTSDKQRALRSCKPLVILTADSPAGVAVYAGEP